MRAVKIETLVSLSIERAKLILFEPFVLKKWLLLLFIAYMAGAMGGGNFNFNYGGSGGGSRKNSTAQAATQAYETSKQQADLFDVQFQVEGPSPVRGNIRPYAGWMLPILIGGSVFLFLLILVIFAWLGARFKFVWFNSIINNDASIRQPFSKYRKEGDSLFKFYLVLGLLFLVFLSLIGAWIYFSLSVEGLLVKGAAWSFIKALKVFALPALIFFGGIIVLVVLTVYIDHFVVTIMAMRNYFFGQAWKEFMVIFKENLKDFLLYLLIMMALGIVSGILAVIILFMCLLAAVIVGGLVFGIPFVLLVLVMKLKALFLGYAILLGVPFFVVVILIVMSIGLPFAVFFRNFSLYFLSSLNCGYLALSFGDNIDESRDVRQ
ncbi:MAG: hypothetical protein JW734_10095 [Candidatus Omnitrophica bacterium]|nr:hypothetical protein [Candidatus Omnitrophota bacterium]